MTIQILALTLAGMGRPRTASVVWKGNPIRPFARLTVGTNPVTGRPSRPWIDLERPDLKHDRPQDVVVAKHLATLLARADGEKGNETRLASIDDFAAEALLAHIRTLLGTSKPWPLHNILRTLADAAEHLMSDHDCDQHGWEDVNRAVGHARAFADIAETLAARLPPLKS